jgi:hypothetical protein
VRKIKAVCTVYRSCLCSDTVCVTHQISPLKWKQSHSAKGADLQTKVCEQQMRCILRSKNTKIVIFMGLDLIQNFDINYQVSEDEHFVQGHVCFNKKPPCEKLTSSRYLKLKLRCASEFGTIVRF